MKLAAAFGVPTSSSSTTIWPLVVSMVAFVTGAPSVNWGGGRWDRQVMPSGPCHGGLRDRHWVERGVVRLAGVWHRADRIHGIHARRHLADDRVRVGGRKRAGCPIAQDDEELRALGVGLARACHRDGPALVWCGHRVVRDRIAGTAGPDLRRVHVRRPAILAVAALDDEARHEPVEYDAVVEAAGGERDEVAGRVRGQRAGDLDHDVALRSGQGDRRRIGRGHGCWRAGRAAGRARARARGGGRGGAPGTRAQQEYRGPGQGDGAAKRSDAHAAASMAAGYSMRPERRTSPRRMPVTPASRRRRMPARSVTPPAITTSTSRSRTRRSTSAGSVSYTHLR